jgi:hypothetical protein
VETETRHVRALSGVIPCIAMQGAGLRGRVGVVAEWRLGGERSGAGMIGAIPFLRITFIFFAPPQGIYNDNNLPIWELLLL